MLARAAILRALCPRPDPCELDSSARVCALTLYEDRPGKPGWISTGPAGSTIDFEVRFGARPLLAVSYLSSWDAAFGDVMVRMRKVYPTARTNKIGTLASKSNCCRWKHPSPNLSTSSAAHRKQTRAYANQHFLFTGR